MIRNATTIVTAATATACLAAAIAASGCRPEPTVGQLVDEYALAVNESIDIICDCWAEFGLDSKRQCTSGSELLPSTRRCLVDAYARDPEAARAYLECYNGLFEDYNDCMDSRLQCSNGDSIDSCGEDFDVGAQYCIELPPSVDRAIDNCFPD
jgi:hypothetical protein